MCLSLEIPSLSKNRKNIKKNEEDPPKMIKKKKEAIYMAEAVSARLSVREGA